MRSTSGSILVITHSRADLLEELLDTLAKIKISKPTPVVVVRQTGVEAVGEVISKWNENITSLIELEPIEGPVARNIARNRGVGYEYCFNTLKADWVLAFEDDALPSRDILMFVQQIMDRYIHSRSFRGINLGSKLKNSVEGLDSYCLTRFGIFGPCSAITTTTWQNIRKYNLFDSDFNDHWDAAIEAYLKTGFMIAPNNSRYIDRGWQGTHTPDSSQDSYFSLLEKSFVGIDYSGGNYHELDLGYFWREDLIKFRDFENFFYWLNFLIRLPLPISIYRKIKKFI